MIGTKDKPIIFDHPHASREGFSLVTHSCGRNIKWQQDLFFVEHLNGHDLSGSIPNATNHWHQDFFSVNQTFLCSILEDRKEKSLVFPNTKWEKDEEGYIECATRENGAVKWNFGVIKISEIHELPQPVGVVMMRPWVH